MNLTSSQGVETRRRLPDQVGILRHHGPGKPSRHLYTRNGTPLSAPDQDSSRSRTLIRHRLSPRAGRSHRRRGAFLQDLRRRDATCIGRTHQKTSAPERVHRASQHPVSTFSSTLAVVGSGCQPSQPPPGPETDSTPSAGSNLDRAGQALRSSAGQISVRNKVTGAVSAMILGAFKDDRRINMASLRCCVHDLERHLSMTEARYCPTEVGGRDLLRAQGGPPTLARL